MQKTGIDEDTWGQASDIALSCIELARDNRKMLKYMSGTTWT
jgi:hypothetical protein